MRVHDVEQLVATAIAEIPERFLARMRNVAIVVEDEPSPEQLEACDVPDDETMYAYYEGVAQVDRDLEEPLLPDRIVVFRRPLLEDFGHDVGLLRREIAVTVRHEIAHHFGIDDDRLDALGKY